MRERILVVEDDERSRRLLVDVLAFHGYGVIAAASAEDALTLCADAQPDAALLDIQLVGMDGFELLRRLRVRHGEMPIIAVTASAMDIDRERILRGGFDAYVPKPVNIRQVLEILRERLTRP